MQNDIENSPTLPVIKPQVPISNLLPTVPLPQAIQPVMRPPVVSRNNINIAPLKNSCESLSSIRPIDKTKEEFKKEVTIVHESLETLGNHYSMPFNSRKEKQ